MTPQIDYLLQVDRNLSADNVAQTCGATASVAIVHSLDAPATPFFSAKKLALTVAHCGCVSLIFFVTSTFSLLITVIRGCCYAIQVEEKYSP